MPTYKGSSQIKRALEYGSVDEHLRKMENFPQIFIEEQGAAMEEIVSIAAAQAKQNAPKLMGRLASTIQGKMLNPDMSKVTIRGALQAKDGMKAFVMEAGRFYSNVRRGKYYWKGKFYLYYGVQDKASEIQAQRTAANERIVNRLVVKP